MHKDTKRMLELAKAQRDIQIELGKTVGCISGYFDPIHPGHISYINESRAKCDFLICIVNGDWACRNKKGRPFMPLDERCYIVENLKCCDFIVPYEINNDPTVCTALEVIKPSFFFNGGDRIHNNIPELDICRKHNITMIVGVGKGKTVSSSNYLKDWVEFVNNQTDERKSS